MFATVAMGESTSPLYLSVGYFWSMLRTIELRASSTPHHTFLSASSLPGTNTFFVENSCTTAASRGLRTSRTCMARAWLTPSPAQGALSLPDE